MSTANFSRQGVRALMTSIRIGSNEAQAGVARYIDDHLVRFTTTLQSVPPSGPDGKLLDVAGLANLIPCYQRLLGYEHITITSASPDSPFVPDGLETAVRALGDVNVRYFDVEFDPFPFPDEHFDTVVCCEVIEHMTVDPMALMAEINRVCKTGGTVVMTTPNIIGWQNLCAHGRGPAPRVALRPIRRRSCPARQHGPLCGPPGGTRAIPAVDPRGQDCARCFVR